MRMLVCGANGQVGSEVVDRAAGFGLKALAMTRQQLDICDADQVERALRELQPGLIINAAAYTHVDNAETHSEQAFAINRDGGAQQNTRIRLNIGWVKRQHELERCLFAFGTHHALRQHF